MILRRRGESMFVVYVDDKKAERQISEIRKKYREFVDAINDLRFDSEFKIIFSSKEKADVNASEKVN